MDRSQLIKKSKFNSWVMFGQSYRHRHKSDLYTNIYEKPELVHACFCDSEDYSIVLKLLCRLHPQQDYYSFNEYEGHYFGWIDIKDNSRIRYVWPSLSQCKMCIGDGEIDHKEKIGEGVIARLIIESLRPASPEDYLPKPIIEETDSEPEIEESVAPMKRKIKRKIMWKKLKDD